MKTRFNSQYESDSTPSRILVERYRSALNENEDESDSNLALVHYRGTRQELDLGLEYSLGLDPKDRITGADVLAQLGWSDRTHLDESVDRLIELLSDESPQVVSAAAIALGHRGDPRAIASVLPLVSHPDALIRYGTVFGLIGHEDNEAIAALITLAGDTDEDVRDWAIFGLGSQIDTDNAVIRRALWQAADDISPDVRGEALVGLAKRNVPGAIDAIIREWQDHEEIRGLSLEAAATFPGFPEDGEFETPSEEMPLETYRARLIAALEACRSQRDDTES